MIHKSCCCHIATTQLSACSHNIDHVHASITWKQCAYPKTSTQCCSSELSGTAIVLLDACMTTPRFVQASGALKRASRGGMLVGAQLQAVASTLVGAARLQRSVMGASNAADGTGDYDLFSALTERIRV